MEFLTENLNQFSEETISLLSFGACIGQSFSVEDLSAVCGLPEQEINRRLITAVGQEAVYPIERMGKPAGKPCISLPTTGSSRCSIQFCLRKSDQMSITGLESGMRNARAPQAIWTNGRLKSRTTMQWGLGRRRIRKNGAGFRSSCCIRRTDAGWYPPSTQRAVPEPPALPAGA